MDSQIKNAAAAIAIPRVLAGFRLRWLVYGAAAYLALRYMSKRGILPEQTNAALGLIDKGIDMAKTRVGLGPDHQISGRQVTHH